MWLAVPFDLGSQGETSGVGQESTGGPSAKPRARADGGGETASSVTVVSNSRANESQGWCEVELLLSRSSLSATSNVAPIGSDSSMSGGDTDGFVGRRAGRLVLCVRSVRRLLVRPVPMRRCRRAIGWGPRGFRPTELLHSWGPLQLCQLGAGRGAEV